MHVLYRRKFENKLIETNMNIFNHTCRKLQKNEQKNCFTILIVFNEPFLIWWTSLKWWTEYNKRKSLNRGFKNGGGGTSISTTKYNLVVWEKEV